MGRLLALILLIMTAAPASAAGLTGLWLTQDRDGVIKISECDGGLCAEIVAVFLDHPNDPMPVDYRGMSQCHLKLISDAKQIRPNLWKGHILDPRNGSIFGVELSLNPNGTLALRGFLGIPLLGQTQTWTQYPGGVAADCRMSASAQVAGSLPSVPERGQ